MPQKTASTQLETFTTFGALLHYLRRRARLTQFELAVAVGYSEAQISRLEQNKRLPDLTTVAALFIPALDLADAPECAARLIELAAAARGESLAGVSLSMTRTVHQVAEELALEPIPPPPPYRIERSHMLARLRARLAAERCVAMCGLAGMGKTTLAAELARSHATIAPVFWLTLTEGITTSVDALIHQIALFLLTYGQEQVTPLLQMEHTGQSMPLGRQVTLLGAALARLTESLPQPPLLCLDNLELVEHDAAIVRVLRHLIAATPALWLLTSREEAPLPGIAQVTLTGLEHDEGMALIKQLLGNAFAPSLAARLLDKTSNPMLLRLAIGQLLDEQADPESFITHLETQPQVASYLLETIRRQLTPAAWCLLTLISVFRHPVNLHDELLIELIQAVEDPCDLSAAMEELQRRHLIDHPDHVNLHPLVRDYIYTAMDDDLPRRRCWHVVAAEWAERGPGDATQAAYHYNRAGRVEQAVDAIVGREDNVIQRGQALVAVDVLGEVLQVVQSQNWQMDSSDLLRRLHSARGYLATGTLRSTEAEASYREALRLTTRPAVRADLVYRMSQLVLQRNAYADALQLVQDAAAALAPADVLLRARLAVAEASALYNLTRLEESHQAALKALALADQLAGVPQPLLEEIRARAHNALANVARVRRDQASTFDHAQQALNAARRGHLRRLENTLLGFLGGLLYDQGDLEASFRFRSEALAGAQAIGDSYWAAYLMIHLSANHYIRCELEAALAKLDQARDILQQIGDVHGVSDQESMRASCLLLQGQIAQARAAIERALPQGESGGRPRMYGYYLNKLAILQTIEGDVIGAQATMQHALVLPVVGQDPMLRFDLHTNLALVLLAAGNAEAAQQALDEAPSLDGLSMWTKLDRRLVEGFVALERGQCQAALEISAAVVDLSPSYPLYTIRAAHLAAAARDPLRTFSPQWMWVKDLARVNS